MKVIFSSENTTSILSNVLASFGAIFNTAGIPWSSYLVATFTKFFDIANSYQLKVNTHMKYMSFASYIHLRESANNTAIADAVLTSLQKAGKLTPQIQKEIEAAKTAFSSGSIDQNKFMQAIVSIRQKAAGQNQSGSNAPGVNSAGITASPLAKDPSDPYGRTVQRVGMGQKTQSNDNARIDKLRKLILASNGVLTIVTRRGQEYNTPDGSGMGKLAGGSFATDTSNLPTIITQEGPEVDLRAVAQLINKQTGQVLFNYDFGDLW